MLFPPARSLCGLSKAYLYELTKINLFAYLSEFTEADIGFLKILFGLLFPMIQTVPRNVTVL